MRTYVLPIFALFIVGCGAYLWANSISQEERLKLLNGEYELVDWQVRPTPANNADSIVLHDIPQQGERITIQIKDNGNFQLTTDSSSHLLQLLSDLEWEPLYIERTWFAWRHRVIGQYHAGEQSATVYWHRAFVNQTDVGITLQQPDSMNERIGWLLIFQKRL